MQQSSQTAFRNWRDALWETYARLQSTSDGAGFYGRVSAPWPGSQSLSIVTSTSQRTERTPNNIRMDLHEFVLCAIQLAGRDFVEQGGRQAATDPGEFVLYETTKPYTLLFDGPFEQLVLKLPRGVLSRPVVNLSSLTGRSIQAGRGAGAVARELIESLVRRGDELGQRETGALIPVAADLVANAIAAQFGDLPNDQAQFERIRHRLGQLVREPDLDLEAFARSERMSSRTLQRLFQINGTTFDRVILETRLEGVMRDLRGAQPFTRPIGDIALSWGFNDLSHFTRAFRARYGTSRGSVRRQCSTDGYLLK